MIADEPAAFANAVVRLVRDAGARHQLEAAARALVVARYDWSAVAQDFEDALARVCHSQEEPVAAGQRTDAAPLPLAGSI